MMSSGARRERYSHSYNAVIVVARYMEPSTRINECRIPTLQDIVRINQISSQTVQCITCYIIHTKSLSLSQRDKTYQTILVPNVSLTTEKS